MLIRLFEFRNLFSKERDITTLGAGKTEKTMGMLLRDL